MKHRMRKEGRPVALRIPKPLFERLKLPLILLAYIAVSEWVDPFPFHVSLPARLAVIALVFFIVRELHHARLEIDADWAGRTERVHARWQRRADRVSRRTWLKLQRIAIWLASAYVFGAVINVLTDRCDGAIQCTVLAPRIAVENLPQFLQFAILVSLTLFQLGIMFYAMVKVGSYKLVMPGTVPVTFDDVWGQDKAKARVLEQVKLLEDSEAVEHAGGHMPKGVLLYGPPGTGKTYLAKAAANYSSKPLILVPPGAFQATFVGINLLKVWMLFRHTRKLARRYGGVIVFIDEIDSLGSRGGEVEGITPKPQKTPGCIPFKDICAETIEPERFIIGTAQMGTLEAFLSAMDGMEEPRGLLNRLLAFLGFKPMKPYEYKYLMLGATNRMGALDPALLRAGRFGRKIHVDYPTVEGRLKTYQGYFSRVRHDLVPEDIEWAARNHTKGTGAAIKDIVNEALLITFRDDRDDPGLVHFRDVMDAMIWVALGESTGPFERDEGRWGIAVHEAGHAVAFHHLSRYRERIWFASIEQRAGAGGMVVPTPLREDWLLTRSELLADVQVSLASRIAEELLLGEATNGHGGDGRAATDRARAMVRYGHAGKIGMYERDTADMREQIEEVLGQALNECQALLEPRKDEIETVARLLYERGTVPGDEIHALLEAT